MPCDEEGFKRHRVEKMMAEAARGDDSLVFENTGFPKQSLPMVGVEWQYSGDPAECRELPDCRHLTQQ
jgi:hypothetical protein